MWQNNILNERIYEELPKDFSLCDLDGCVHCFYPGGVRLIIYECKRQYEKLSKTQLNALRLLKKFISWENFDEYSGVFIIRELEDNFKTFIIEDLEENYIRKADIKYLHAWFSCKDKKK